MQFFYQKTKFGKGGDSDGDWVERVRVRMKGAFTMTNPFSRFFTLWLEVAINLQCSCSLFGSEDVYTQTHKSTDTDTHGHIDTWAHMDTQTHKHTDIDTRTHKHRYKHTDTDIQTRAHRDSHKGWYRHTDFHIFNILENYPTTFKIVLIGHRF